MKRCTQESHDRASVSEGLGWADDSRSGENGEGER